MPHDSGVGTRGTAVAAVVLLVVGGLVGGLVGALLALGLHRASGQVVATCHNDSGDAERVQDAIDGTSTGDEVVFDGPCEINETIVLLGGRAYRGESPTTTLRAAPGSNLRTVLASDSWVLNKTTTGLPISLRDLTVDAARKDNPRGGDGVTIRSWHSQIEDVRVTNARRTCLRVTGRSSDGTDLPEQNTQVNGTLHSIFAFHCGSNGIFVEDKGNSVTDWNLTDSWIGDTGGDGIRMDNAAGWTVSGNHLFDIGGNGIDALRLFATSVSDNYIEDFGDEFGIAAYAQGSAASVVTGNRVFQVGDTKDGTLVEVVGAREGTSVVSVTGNVLIGNGTGTGLSYRSEGADLSVTSQSNSVSGVVTPLAGTAPNGGF